MRRGGWWKPAFRRAPQTRSLASDRAASGRPTIVKPGRPGATSTSTLTGRPVVPGRVAESGSASMHGTAGPAPAHTRKRMPSFTWHLAHLYDPRMVVPSSVMPAYKWYFKDVGAPAAGERKVQLTEAMRRTLGPNAEVWATRDAVALVEYLISLLPAGRAKRP